MSFPLLLSVRGGVGEPGPGAGCKEPPSGVRQHGAALHRQGSQQERHLLEQVLLYTGALSTLTVGTVPSTLPRGTARDSEGCSRRLAPYPRGRTRGQ